MKSYIQIMDICRPGIVQGRDEDKRGYILEAYHLNFPKFHSMTYVTDSITAFGITNGTDSSQGELLHGKLLKTSFGKTNGHKEFEIQQLRWVTTQTGL